MNGYTVNSLDMTTMQQCRRRTSELVVIAVDPSIAKPGAALFRVRTAADLLIADRWCLAARDFVSATRMRTDTAAASVRRAAEVGAWVADLVRTHAADVVVIEVPPASGTYHGKRRAQRSKSDLNAAALVLLNRAIGAAAHGAEAAGARVVELAAVDASREFARGIVAGAINSAARIDPGLARSLVVDLGGEATVGKKVRHRVMQSLLDAYGHALPKQEDARDAAWLGMQYIATELS